MSALVKRLSAIEKQVLTETETRFRAERWWTCYARDGHEEEDIAEAARLAGVIVGIRDVLIVGFMSPSAPSPWPIPPMQPFDVRVEERA